MNPQIFLNQDTNQSMASDLKSTSILIGHLNNFMLFTIKIQLLHNKSKFLQNKILIL